MKKALTLFSMVAGLMITSNARAGLLFEPNLAYDMSVIKMESGGVDIGGKVTGTEIGARLGFTFPVMFWVAADYSMLSGGGFDSPLPGLTGKVDRSNLYVDFGVNLPVLLRAWIGYGIQNSAKIKFDSGSTLELNGGSALKLGLGVTTLPFVSVNFEYFQNSFEKSISNGVESSVSSQFSTFKDTGFRVGVSLPLNL